MPIPIRDTFPTDRDDLIVQVTDDGSLTLVKTTDNDAFHSGCGALAETDHVYCKGSGVADRLARRQHTRVLEVGLGTAMGMLLTVDAAIASGTSLEYVAIETDWISGSTLQYLRPRDWVAKTDLVDAYMDFRKTLPDVVPGGTYRWCVDSQRLVTIEVADVRQWSLSAEGQFDAIYYDPFCPESAPDLWTPSSMKAMRGLIAADGKLATYSCSRTVRNALEQSGWGVARVPGPIGGKREVIVATPV
ncbi:MAG: tRNA (5-methylaminomethyl-2-thiouridine)(34)-methyltransferase MnmD [Planctomycetales bacterium]|nr:tRNA (5-methylaminomethyl-2-thiouridine)(34)-methyltransferase MnmD [Planctomycetales bacterium]